MIDRFRLNIKETLFFDDKEKNVTTANELVQGISKKQESYNSYLSEEIKNEEKEIFANFYSKTNSCTDKC